MMLSFTEILNEKFKGVLIFLKKFFYISKILEVPNIRQLFDFLKINFNDFNIIIFSNCRHLKMLLRLLWILRKMSTPLTEMRYSVYRFLSNFVKFKD